MATIYPDFGFPRDLNAGPTKFLRPVYGASLQSFANVTNHLVGWRCRRAVHMPIDWGNSVITQDPSGITAPVRVWWQTHELAEWCAVVFRYQTYDTVSGGASVDLDLLLKTGDPGTGAAVDGTVTFDRNNGLSSERRSVAGTDQYQIMTATTGDRIPRDTSSTLPRPLEITSAARNTWVELTLTPTSVRIISVDVMELHRTEITI